MMRSGTAHVAQPLFAIKTLMEVSMPFECFSDPAYFDMWAVRDIENRSFNEVVHVECKITAANRQSAKATQVKWQA